MPKTTLQSHWHMAYRAFKLALRETLITIKQHFRARAYLAKSDSKRRDRERFVAAASERLDGFQIIGTKTLKANS